MKGFSYKQLISLMLN